MYTFHACVFLYALQFILLESRLRGVVKEELNSSTCHQRIHFPVCHADNVE
jgi:hypothetical protein